MPVSDGLMAEPVNAETPIFRFSPNRDVTWSRDWNFSIVNDLRVNNAGFVNNQDYREDGQPLLAIVGDSYIEAAMVPFEETLQGRMADRLKESMRVYSFAASGAPLSQYVIWAKEARERYGATRLAILVVGNDFDESLIAYKSAPGFHYYARDGAGSLSLQRQDYQPSALRRALRQSATFRYLALNLHALEHLRRLIRDLAPPALADDFAGNTSSATGDRRMADSRDGVAAFLRDLVQVAGWVPSEVVFLLDGFRYPEAAASAPESYFALMRRHFMDEARKQGFEVIDLDPLFFARTEADGSRFEFPTDGHWNGVAHGIAADALAGSDLFVAQ